MPLRPIDPSMETRFSFLLSSGIQTDFVLHLKNKDYSSPDSATDKVVNGWKKT